MFTFNPSIKRDGGLVLDIPLVGDRYYASPQRLNLIDS